MKNIQNLEETVNLPNEYDNTRNIKPESPQDSWYRKMVNWYFKPRDFEKKGKLYKALGMNLIRKYVPNGGSYWIKKKKELPQITTGNKKELESIIEQTKNPEIIHLIGIAACLVLGTKGVLEALNTHSSASIPYIIGGIWAIGNHFMNILPVMSLRYIRAKSYDLLERKEKLLARIANKEK